MNMQLQTLKTLTLSVFSAMMLVACGGGGGSDTVAPASSSIPNNQYSSEIYGDTTGFVGQSVGLVFVQSVSEKDSYDSYRWTQTSGGQVTITANTQSAISFTPTLAGDYTFQLRLYKEGKLVKTLYKTVNIQQTNSEIASLRTDRAVGSGGSFSLRFYTKTPLTSTQWKLTQTSGVPVTIRYHSSEAMAEISVPDVTTDQLLSFKAVSTENENLSDTVYVVVKAKTHADLPPVFFCNRPTSGVYCLPLNSLSHHHPYDNQSEYAGYLTDCVMSNELNDQKACTLQSLPFIGMETDTPSVDDIMQRVVVSHDWMAENFKRFLLNYDTHGDFRRLLRSTTAIVISENVRPSFYWGGVGAIYLDPAYLWMTPEQRDDLIEIADYRSEYGNELNFLEIDDYEKNKRSIYNSDYFTDIKLRKSRNLETIAMPLATLLYHELAHANDYMPYPEVKKLIGTNGQYQTANSVLVEDKISDQLTRQYPLIDTRLKSLAQVSYGGETATSNEKSYTPAQVGQWFFADRGVALYSFYNEREDLAMLFEESMMLSRFGVSRYNMFFNTGRPYQLARGEKNWVANQSVKPRANFVVSQILPEASVEVQQKLANTNSTSLCVGRGISNYYDTDCSKSYTMANAYFGQYNNHQLPKTPTRGITPIESKGMMR